MDHIQKPSNDNADEKNKEKINLTLAKGAAFILGISIFGGLTASVISAKITKKKILKYYKDLNIEPEIKPESPVVLGFKALGLATLYTVGLFSIVGFATCKWFDIKSLEDLRKKVQSWSRKNKKTNEEKLEFESFSDFVKYLENSSSKPKEHQKQD